MLKKFHKCASRWCCTTMPLKINKTLGLDLHMCKSSRVAFIVGLKIFNQYLTNIILGPVHGPISTIITSYEVDLPITCHRVVHNCVHLLNPNIQMMRLRVHNKASLCIYSTLLCGISTRYALFSFKKKKETRSLILWCWIQNLKYIETPC